MREHAGGRRAVNTIIGGHIFVLTFVAFSTPHFFRATGGSLVQSRAAAERTQLARSQGRARAPPPAAAHGRCAAALRLRAVLPACSRGLLLAVLLLRRSCSRSCSRSPAVAL